VIVCHCNAVSDRTIRKTVRDGAASLAEVGFACGAATCCGGCASSVAEIIGSEVEARDDTAVLPSPGLLPAT